MIHRNPRKMSKELHTEIIICSNIEITELNKLTKKNTYIYKKKTAENRNSEEKHQT